MIITRIQFGPDGSLVFSPAKILSKYFFKGKRFVNREREILIKFRFFVLPKVQGSVRGERRRWLSCAGICADYWAGLRWKRPMSGFLDPTSQLRLPARKGDDWHSTTLKYSAPSLVPFNRKKLSFVYLAFLFQTWPVVSVWIPWLTASPRLLSNSSAVVNLDLLPLYVFRKCITPLQRERNYEWLKLPLGVPLADLLPSLEGLDVLKWMRRNPHIKVNLNKN